MFFYVGLALSALLAVLSPFISTLPLGGLFMIAVLIVFGHSHFLVAYLYYIDILRLTFSGNRKKLFLYLASFVAIILLFYFAKYVWFVSFAPLFSLVVFTVFISHHTENMFFLGEDFSQNFRRKKRSNLNVWLIPYFVALFMSFMTYAYYVLERGNTDTIFTIWVFLLSFFVLCFTVYKLYKKIAARRMLLLLSVLLVFAGPFLLQNVSFEKLSIIAMFWHFLAWFILYGVLLYSRNSGELPQKIKLLPSSAVSNFLRKTRSNVWNYLMFQVAFIALVAFLYVLTARVQGFAPLSNEMVNGGFFWGWAYFEMWTFAHIIFTILPKGVANQEGGSHG